MKKIISLLMCFLLILPSVYVIAATQEETDGDESENIVKYETVEEVLLAAEEKGAENLTIEKNFYNGEQHYFKGSSNKITHREFVDPDDGKEYCRVEVTSIGENATGSHIQLLFNASGVDVETGDIMFFAYKIKAISSNHSTGRIVGSGKYRLTSSGSELASISFRIPVPENGEEPEWIWCYKAFQVGKNTHTADKAAHVDFFLGEAVQTVELKDITIINFKDMLTLDSFPKKETSYEGMEEDAPWRKAAEERIEKYRKSDIKVKVVDKSGNPIEGAKVNTDQQKHKFRFGSYMRPRRMSETENVRQNKAFQEQFKKMFNTTGFENIFKPANIGENEEDIQKIIDFAESNDMSLRGHTLVWRENDAKGAMTEEDLNKYEAGDAETKKKIMTESVRAHIAKYTEKYGEYIDSWDVVNEFLNHTDEIYRIIGEDKNEVANWFKLASQNTGDASLVLNDFGIISYDETKQNSHLSLAKELKELGAPITTVGMQAHLGSAVPPEYLYSILEKFSGSGLDIEITEFTYENENEEIQGKYVRDFLTTVFSHPSASSVYLWGFTADEIGNRRTSALCKAYNSSTNSYELRESGKWWMKLIYEDWWSNEEGTTSDTGLFETRVFQGDHQVTVTLAGEEKSFVIEDLGTASKQYVFNFDTGYASEIKGEFDEKGLKILLDEENGKFTVEGNGSFAGGEDVTMLVQDSNGGIVYFDQVHRMAEDGSFSVSAEMADFLHTDNQYVVKMGSQGRESVKFWLWGDMHIFDYRIKSLEYKNASGKLNSFDDINNNDEISAEIRLEAREKQAAFIGLYDKNGKLLKVNFAQGERTGANEVTCKVGLSVGDMTDADHIKLFVWDDNTNINPFAEAFLFS